MFQSTIPITLHSIKLKMVIWLSINVSMVTFMTVILRRQRSKDKKNHFYRCNFIGGEGISVEVEKGYNNFSYCNIFNASIAGIVAYSSHQSFYRCNFSNNWIGLQLESYSDVVESNFYHNHIAILLSSPKKDVIRKNFIIENKIGIEISAEIDSRGMGMNDINYNSFIKNDVHAIIYFLGKILFFYNNWTGNYWDNWIPYIPKPILCEDLLFKTYFFSWLNVDWHPLPLVNKSNIVNRD